MLKGLTASCLILLCSVVQASQPSASLNAASAQEIVNVFKDEYEDDFKREMKKTPQMAFPTAEQSYIYSQYMNKAFAKAGYSLDETLYDYLRGERTANVILFMSKLHLETYAIFLKSDSVGGSFVKSGAISQRTFDYAKNIARDIPIINADYSFEANPAYKIDFLEQLPKDYESHTERLLGNVKQGSKIWEDWLYLETLSVPGEEHGIGLIDTTKATPEELRIWKSLTNKKVKVEGTYFTAKGIEIGGSNSGETIRNPNFFDMRKKILFKLL